jgi:hypothetical protein
MNSPEENNWEANAFEDDEGNVVPIDDVLRDGYERPENRRRGLGVYALKPEIIDDNFELTDQEKGQLILDKLNETREDWAWDMLRAFDDYQFAEISLEEISSMTNVDRKTYALHFQKFWSLLRRDNVLITANIRQNNQGDLELDESSASVDEIKALYGTHTPEELLEYAHRLKQLEGGLILKGIVHALKEELRNQYPEASKSPGRIESILFKDKRNYGDCKIVFDVNADGVRKPKIERIPRVERKLAA